ncbi:MAG: hypothetical protein HC800_24375, partial [Phormidesmis sp. RL_2_1]|nr:hypothetical protein [Phormidesmis sp. RL_2_1]
MLKNNDRSPVYLEDDTATCFSDRHNFQTLDYTNQKKVNEFLEGNNTEAGKQPLAKNPWVRIGIAVAFIAFTLGFGALFMLGGDKPKEIADTEPETQEEVLTLSLNREEIAPSSQTAGQSEEVDVMKARLALMEQQLALSQIERGEKPNPEPEPRAVSSRTASSSTAATRSTPPPTTRPISRVNTTRQPPSPPATRTVTRTVSAPARPIPQRTAPTPVARPSQPISTFEPVDPQAEWEKASNAGVIGVMPAPPSPIETDVSGVEAPERLYQLKSATPTAEPASYSEPVASSSLGPKGVPGLYDEAPSAAVVPMGQSVRATVDTAITWIDGNDQFMIQLDEPILDADGFVAIPVGAYLIAQPVSVDGETGLAEVAVVGAAIGNEVIELDYRTISVTGANGDPLIADRYGDVGGEYASNDVEMFLIGAIG